jgi:hypothetical protein
MKDVDKFFCHLVCFIDNWYILWPLLYFVIIGTLFPVLVYCAKKNLATLVGSWHSIKYCSSSSKSSGRQISDQKSRKIEFQSAQVSNLTRQLIKICNRHQLLYIHRKIKFYCLLCLRFYNLPQGIDSSQSACRRGNILVLRGR